MKFEITYDETGEPAYVNTDNGWMMESRKFDPDRDGWMETQLNPSDFEGIRVGREMSLLIAEVNDLRRQLFHAKKDAKGWRQAAGF